MRRVILAGLASVAATAALSATVFDGRWALLDMPCADETAILAINTVRGDLLFAETRCILVMDEAIGDYGLAWNVELICSGEGESWVRNLLLAVVQPPGGGPDLLVEVDYEDGFVVGRARCG
ncbi:MAG: hypothetical protein KIS68_16515 [Bauldia sp.]|nr:hypothetical protein [Bauldia sp.]